MRVATAMVMVSSLPCARRAPRLDGLAVLVVEDNADAREITRRMLEAEGARVVLAGDGCQGLYLLEEAAPDVILCDLRMPNVDGIEFTRRLRANSRRAHLPVIAVTALDEYPDYLRTWEVGFDAHVVKPVDYDLLAVTILRVLQTRPLSKRGRQRRHPRRSGGAGGTERAA